MRLLRFLIRSSLPLFISSAAVGALSGVVGAALIGVINEILRLPDGADRGHLVLPFLSLMVLFPATWALSQYLLVLFGERAIQRLRSDLSRQILATPLRRLEEVGTARLLSNLSEGLSTLTFSLRMVPNLYVNLATLLGCLGYLLWLEPQLFPVLAILIALGVVFHRLFMRLGQAQFERGRETFDELYEHFRGLTEGLQELKLHRDRRDAFLNDLDHTGEELRRLNTSSTAYFGLANSWARVLLFLVIALLFFVLPKFSPMSQAALMSYVLVLLYMRTPLTALMGTVPHVTRSNVVLAKIDRLGLKLDSEALSAPAKDLSADWRSLELHGVAYRYTQENGRGFALGPVDLRLEPGEIVFLVGGNGSGKTTLGKLLLGLYSPQEGEVLLNGQPIGDADMEAYRNLFSAISSEFYLFKSLLGLPQERLDATAEEYLSLLRLDHKVDIRDGRFSTIDLSRGQRKRLALLVAYLEDRPIYLFDEWAADQDPTFKEFFYRRLLPDFKARGKTVLAITHDDRYFDAADRILKLDSGQLVAAPTTWIASGTS